MGCRGNGPVGEMACRRKEFGKMSFRRDGIRRNGVGEMGVGETAVGEMTCNRSKLQKEIGFFKPNETPS